MRVPIAIVVGAFSLAAPTDPAFGNGGGGGGGGISAPSASAPAYDPANDYRRGLEALRASDYKAAQKAFRGVLSAAPRDANVNYLAGLAASGAGDNKRAAGYFEKATKYDPNLVGAYRQLGVVKAKLGDGWAATAARDVLAGKLAACGDACADAAELKAGVAEIDAAIAAGPQARLDPRLPEAFASAADGDQAYLAAVSLINERRYDTAITSLEAARLSFGAHPDILTYLGFANRKLGRFDVAERYYRAALAIAPSHRGALEYDGELKVERGDIAGARRNLARLERACVFGCHEAEELRRWIASGRAPAA